MSTLSGIKGSGPWISCKSKRKDELEKVCRNGVVQQRTKEYKRMKIFLQKSKNRLINMCFFQKLNIKLEWMATCVKELAFIAHHAFSPKSSMDGERVFWNEIETSGFSGVGEYFFRFGTNRSDGYWKQKCLQVGRRAHQQDWNITCFNLPKIYKKKQEGLFCWRITSYVIYVFQPWRHSCVIAQSRDRLTNLR